jgi:hypothetical protein
MKHLCQQQPLTGRCATRPELSDSRDAFGRLPSCFAVQRHPDCSGAGLFDFHLIKLELELAWLAHFDETDAA